MEMGKQSKTEYMGLLEPPYSEPIRNDILNYKESFIKYLTKSSSHV